MAPKYYHEDDAALIHASIHEIIKIWQRSSGQANLSLKIDNGLCELNLSVNLGQASSDPDTHVAGTNLPSNHNTSLLRKNGRKRKSPSQRMRDYKSAETFRKRKMQERSIHTHAFYRAYIAIEIGCFIGRC